MELRTSDLLKSRVLSQKRIPSKSFSKRKTQLFCWKQESQESPPPSLAIARRECPRWRTECFVRDWCSLMSNLLLRPLHQLRSSVLRLVRSQPKACEHRTRTNIIMHAIAQERAALPSVWVCIWWPAAKPRAWWPTCCAFRRLGRSCSSAASWPWVGTIMIMILHDDHDCLHDDRGIDAE